MPSEAKVLEELDRAAFRPATWDETTPLVLFSNDMWSPAYLYSTYEGTWSLEYGPYHAQVMDPTTQHSAHIPFASLKFVKHGYQPMLPFPDKYIMAYDLSSVWVGAKSKINLVEFAQWLAKFQLPVRVVTDEYDEYDGQQVVNVSIHVMLPLNPCRNCLGSGIDPRGPFGLCSVCEGTRHVPWRVVQEVDSIWTDFTVEHAEAIRIALLGGPDD